MPPLRAVPSPVRADVSQPRSVRSSAPLAPAAPSELDAEWEASPATRPGAGVAATGAPLGVAVALASPKGGVGKTTIALNLACSVAQRGLRTILIDADINGDLLSALASRERVERGVYDVLGTPAGLDAVIRATSVPRLELVPAAGATLPAAATARRSMAAEWRALIEQARQRADLVLIDCPAGMFDVTADVLAACTHVVGVLQSDMIASRSASMLERGLAALAPEARPRLVGTVVNMFQGRSASSMEAFHRIALGDSGTLLFETTIPRSDAFTSASLVGLPVGLAGRGGAPAPVAWLFDMLATEVCDRTGIAEIGTPAPPSTFLR
ncbi:MAG: ParA family protein [Kofleriaceae bacterium]|nr:ParA family protein [Kofleriaceae bacterium]